MWNTWTFHSLSIFLYHLLLIVDWKCFGTKLLSGNDTSNIGDQYLHRTLYISNHVLILIPFYSSTKPHLQPTWEMGMARIFFLCMALGRWRGKVLTQVYKKVTEQGLDLDPKDSAQHPLYFYSHLSHYWSLKGILFVSLVIPGKSPSKSAIWCPKTAVFIPA